MLNFFCWVTKILTVIYIYVVHVQKCCTNAFLSMYALVISWFKFNSAIRRMERLRCQFPKLHIYYIVNRYYNIFGYWIDYYISLEGNLLIDWPSPKWLYTETKPEQLRKHLFFLVEFTLNFTKIRRMRICVRFAFLKLSDGSCFLFFSVLTVKK